MKKILIITLVISMLVGLAACNSNSGGLELDRDYPIDDVPLYDDAIIIEQDIEDDEMSIEYLIEDDLDDLIEFYQEFFEEEEITTDQEEKSDSYTAEGIIDEYLFCIYAKEADDNIKDTYATTVEIDIEVLDEEDELINDESDEQETETDSGIIDQSEETTETTDPIETIIYDRKIYGDELFDNVNARRAVAVGFDKNFIVDEIYGDSGSVAADYYVPCDFSYGPEGTKYEGVDFQKGFVPEYTYDPERAAELWELAKQELEFSEAEITLLNYDSNNAGKVGEHIKEELERNLEGLTVTIRQLPFAEKLDEAELGNFDMNFAGWGPDYQDPMTFIDMWVTNAPYNEAGWSNTDFDALVETAKDPDIDYVTRWEIMKEAEELILSEFPIVPMYQRGGTRLQNPEVTGIYKHGFGADYSYKWTDKPVGDDGRKVLNLVESSDIPDMDQNDATDSVSFEMLNNTNEGLLRLTENDIVTAGVADIPTFDEATNTYTFNLNPDAVFVDSKGEYYANVTAQDFVYSWDRLVSDDLGAQYSFMLDVAGIVSYEAVDDHTLTVTVKTKTPFFESLMTFPVFMPISEDFVNSVGNSRYGTSVETMLFNGPFYMSSWKIGEEVQLMKNENYWDAVAVNLDEIYIRVINSVENNTAVEMYLAGEIDRVGLSGENVNLYKDRDDAISYGETTVFYLSINIDNNN